MRTINEPVQERKYCEKRDFYLIQKLLYFFSFLSFGMCLKKQRNKN